MTFTKDKNIILGVTGGVGAFKACELLRLFIKAGSRVRVIMTSSAVEFVTPLSFRSLGAESVSIDMFRDKRDSLEHVSWADWGDIIVIAPATANIIGKMAGGIADEVLSTQVMTFDGPILLAPAMNVKMLNNKTVQRNFTYLRSVGINFIGPEVGQLASLVTAAGRMVEPEMIFARARQILIGRNDLLRKKIVVTAGPTRESLDPVRYLSNRSSGKMGYSLADAAAGFGDDVVLISGPTDLSPPPSTKLIRVQTASEMQAAVRKHCHNADFLYMAAAVADYRPTGYHKQKIKRSSNAIKMDLQPTPDILGTLGKNRPRIVVGFALETENLEARALKKLSAKKLDMIVANNPTIKEIEFGSDFNRAILFIKGGKRLDLEKMPKFDLAVRIIDESLKLRVRRGSKRKK